MTAVYKRELRSFFTSMIGYVYVAAVMCCIGIYFTVYNMVIGYPTFSTALNSAYTIFMLITPIITMRTMAEDRKTKSDQLLLTSPASVGEIVLGKYFSTLTVFAIPLIISCICPLIINMYGSGYMLGDYATIFAVFCLGAMLVAIGIFVSSLTDSQIIAAVITFIIFAILSLWSGISYYLPSEPLGSAIGIAIIWLVASLLIYALSKNKLLSLIIGIAGVAAITVFYFVKSELFDGLLIKLLSPLSITLTIGNFATYNVFDVKGIFFYLSMAVLFVFVTIKTVQKRRWN